MVITSSCVFIITNLINIQIHKKEIKNVLSMQVGREASIVNYMFNNESNTAVNIADIINSISSYNENIIFDQINKKLSNDKLLFGMGIWLEQYKYNKRLKYYGPYIYKDDKNKHFLTYAYSTPDYNYFNQDWYKHTLSLKRKKIYYSKAFYDSILNTYFITGGSPIIVNNRAIGVVTADTALGGIIDYIDKIKVGQRGRAFLLSDMGFLEVSPSFNKIVRVNKLMSKQYKNLVNKIAASKSGGLIELKANNQIAAYSSIGETDLKLVLMYSRDELYSPLTKTSIYCLMLFIIATILSIIFLRSILKRLIAEPLDLLMVKVNKIIKGDLTSDNILDCVVNKNFEFGVLAKAIIKMSENLNQLITSLNIQNNQLEESRKRILKSEESYRLIFEASNEGLWEMDLITKKRFYSDRWHEIFDEKINSESIENLGSWFDAIHPEDYNHMRQLHNDIEQGKCEIINNEYRVQGKDGRYIWILTRAKSLKDSEGRPYKLAGSHTDITQKKFNEEKIKKLAYYDDLTELPNRMHFIEMINDRITKASLKAEAFAILFIDLDSFKLINDSYGHTIGDEVLIHVAYRLKTLFDQGVTVSRFGGDEFAIIVDNINNENDVLKIAKDVHILLQEPFLIEDHVFYLSTSIGISIYPVDGQTADELLKNADTAMYKAKEEGRNKSILFNKEMNTAVIEKTEIESGIRKGMEKGEFRLYYQPFFELSTNKIIGFEALVRWFNPNKGMIPPDKFIKIAEDTKLIIPLGKWIIREACLYVRQLIDRGHKAFKIAINVSIVQLMEKDFSDVVTKAIEDAGVPFECIEIEITESKLMESYNECINNIVALTAKGVDFAIDDFGTGYSSLYYLNHLPISVIKIDKSFVDDLSHNSSKSLIELIIVLSHTLGLKVIAEGVEDKERLEILKRYGCDIIQGYYISKPLPEDAALKLLEEGVQGL